MFRELTEEMKADGEFFNWLADFDVEGLSVEQILDEWEAFLEELKREEGDNELDTE